MNELVKNVVLNDKCNLFKKDICNVTFQSCRFSNLILSDIKFENVEFWNCKFESVFVEAFYAKNILIMNSEIESLSLRGTRRITKNKLFGGLKQRGLDEVKFEDNRIVELALGGDLQTNQCSFPVGENYTHIINPFLVYTQCIEYISEKWDGEKKRIGLIELQIQLNKGVEKQREDFLAYSDDEGLARDAREIFKAVFMLIKEIAQKTKSSTGALL